MRKRQMKCPECRSTRLIKFGLKFAHDWVRGGRRRVQQYQCKHCGRITIHPVGGLK